MRITVSVVTFKLQITTLNNAYFNIFMHLFCCGYPPWGPGGLSRECVLRIPMRVVKGD